MSVLMPAMLSREKQGLEDIRGMDTAKVRLSDVGKSRGVGDGGAILVSGRRWRWEQCIVHISL